MLSAADERGATDTPFASALAFWLSDAGNKPPPDLDCSGGAAEEGEGTLEAHHRGLDGRVDRPAHIPLHLLQQPLGRQPYREGGVTLQVQMAASAFSRNATSEGGGSFSPGDFFKAAVRAAAIAVLDALQSSKTRGEEGHFQRGRGAVTKCAGLVDGFGANKFGLRVIKTEDESAIDRRGGYNGVELFADAVLNVAAERDRRCCGREGFERQCEPMSSNEPKSLRRAKL